MKWDCSFVSFVGFWRGNQRLYRATPEVTHFSLLPPENNAIYEGRNETMKEREPGRPRGEGEVVGERKRVTEEGEGDDEGDGIRGTRGGEGGGG